MIGAITNLYSEAVDGAMIDAVRSAPLALFHCHRQKGFPRFCRRADAYGTACAELSFGIFGMSAGPEAVRPSPALHVADTGRPAGQQRPDLATEPVNRT